MRFVISGLVLLLMVVLNLAPVQYQVESENIPVCEYAYTPDDLVFFQRLAEIEALFLEEADDIWTHEFLLHEEPLLFLTGNDQLELTHGYLMSHPNIGAVDLELCRVPQLIAHLPELYKLLELPDDENLQVPMLNFDYEIGGAEMFLMSYKLDMILFTPESFDWILFTEHEAFHQYQHKFWDWRGESRAATDEDYPLDAEHIAMSLLEQELLHHAFTTENLKVRDEALKQFVAVRTTRLGSWEGLEWDTQFELVEGTARYTEYKLIELTGRPTDFIRQFTPAEDLQLLATEGIRNQVQLLVGHTRYYATGGVLGLILDKMGIEWKSRIHNGENFIDVLTSHFNIFEDEYAQRVENAKNQYNFEQLLFWSEALSELAIAQGGRFGGRPLTFPYELPEARFEISPTLIPSTIPKIFELAETYLVPANDIDPAERFLYSTEGEDVSVLRLTGEGNTRIHLSQTRYESLDEWFDAEVKTSKRMPVVDLRVINGVQFAVSYGSYGSVIFIHDDQLVHIAGDGSMDNKLELAQSVLRVDE